MNNQKSFSFASLIYRFLIVTHIVAVSVLGAFAQNCPYMSTYCADAPLLCALDVLNGNSDCYLVHPNDYEGDLCDTECLNVAQNTVRYVFTSNGEPYVIRMFYSNCHLLGNTIGIQMSITSECCGGETYNCDWGLAPATSLTLYGKLPPCKIYYLTIDGLGGTYCDYYLTVEGGAANVPLVLKNINNDANNIIETNKGACDFKFKVDPRDAPCEGYYEWALDGVTIDDHDREIKLSFPDEGDFELCVMGYWFT